MVLGGRANGAGPHDQEEDGRMGGGQPLPPTQAGWYLQDPHIPFVSSRVLE